MSKTTNCEKRTIFPIYLQHGANLLLPGHTETRDQHHRRNTFPRDRHHRRNTSPTANFDLKVARKKLSDVVTRNNFWRSKLPQTQRHSTKKWWGKYKKTSNFCPKQNKIEKLTRRIQSDTFPTKQNSWKAPNISYCTRSADLDTVHDLRSLVASVDVGGGQYETNEKRLSNGWFPSDYRPRLTTSCKRKANSVSHPSPHHGWYRHFLTLSS